jgi:hypothetical protein
MVNLFGGRGGDADSRSGDAVACETSELEVAIERAIRSDASRFKFPSISLVLSLLEAVELQLSRRQRRVLAKIERLLARAEIQGEEIKPELARQRGYVHIVHAGQGTAGASPSTPPADMTVPAHSLPALIKQKRHEAGAIAPNAVKLIIHAVCAGTVVAIEITLFHAALGVAFEPIAGAPTQAISNGMLAFVCLTAIIGGLWSFQDASERMKRLLKKISRIAVGGFVAGSGLFVGNAIFRSLFDSASAANFDVTDTGSIGLLGSIGLALVFGSGGTLAWMASHHSLNRIKTLFDQLTHSFACRNQAARMERDMLDGTGELASAQHELDEIAEARANAAWTVAVRVSALCAPAVTAGHTLLTQLDLGGAPTSDLVPDPLTAEALTYDRKVLRKKVTRLEQQAEPAAILRKIRKALSKKGKVK